MMFSQASHDFHPCQMLPICGEDILINICLILFENKRTGDIDPSHHCQPEQLPATAPTPVQTRPGS